MAGALCGIRPKPASGRALATIGDEGETPDFALYDEKGPAGFVEVVEALRPGYRRHDFFKEDAKSSQLIRQYPVDPPLPDPWVSLRYQISKKAKKTYPPRTTLVAFYDLSRSTFRDHFTPFDQLLLKEHATEPFEGLPSFYRVLVLNCDLKSMVELRPLARTIVPDDPFR